MANEDKQAFIDTILLAEADVLTKYDIATSKVDFEEVERVMDKVLEDELYSKPEDERGIDRDALVQFAADLIEAFENELDEAGVELDNPEKEDSDCPANLYGEDWDTVADTIYDQLEERGWGSYWE